MWELMETIKEKIEEDVFTHVNIIRFETEMNWLYETI